MYKIERTRVNGDKSATGERWNVWQEWLGEDYCIATVFTVDEARATIGHFQSHGSPSMNTEEFHAADDSLCAVLDSIRRRVTVVD